MSIIVETRQALLDPLTVIIQNVVTMLPGILAGLIILIFGYLVANLVAYAVKKVVVKMQLEKWLFDKTDLKSVTGKFDLGTFAHTLVKWYIFVFFIGEAADIVQLVGLSE